MLPKTARSAQTHKSMSFIWIVWSTLYVYLCLKAGFFLCVFEADKTKNEFDQKVSSYQYICEERILSFKYFFKCFLWFSYKNVAELLTIKNPKTQIWKIIILTVNLDWPHSFCIKCWNSDKTDLADKFLTSLFETLQPRNKF